MHPYYLLDLGLGKDLKISMTYVRSKFLVTSLVALLVIRQPSGSIQGSVLNIYSPLLSLIINLSGYALDFYFGCELVLCGLRRFLTVVGCAVLLPEANI